MQTTTELGMNRTGMDVATPEMKELMLEDTDITEPSSEGDEMSLARLRQPYMERAQPLGSLPEATQPSGTKSKRSKAMASPQVFMDKLGERLAFERTGTRLYEAFLGKCEAVGGAGTPPLEEVRHFRDEEASHFMLVHDAIESLGGDATEQTPCADVAGVESAGLLQVMTDPKTSIAQSLHALLVGELTDNCGWEELIALAEQQGAKQLVKQFSEALKHEQEHLQKVKGWHQAASMALASGKA